MRKLITYCDKCNKEGALTYTATVDRRLAGSPDDVTEEVDLCDSCAAKQLSIFIQAMTWELREEVFRSLQKKEFHFAEQIKNRPRGGLLIKGMFP